MQIIKSRSWAIFSQFTAKFINFTAIFAKLKTQLFIIGFVWYLPHRRSEAFWRVWQVPFFLFFALGIYRPCWKYCLYKTSKKCIFCVRYRWAVPEIYKTWEKSDCQSIKQSFHYIDAKLCANLTINGGCF